MSTRRNNTMRFGRFKISLGNGANPEVYSAPIGFTSKSFVRTKELSEQTIPSENPDEVLDVIRDAISRSASINGSGVMMKTAYPVWKAAYEADESVSVKIEFDYGTEITTIIQRFHLTSFEQTADFNERVQVSVSLESDGEYTEVTA